MTISNSLRYTFLINFIVCLIFGVLFFLSPEYVATATGWPFVDPTAGRIMGSMFLGWAFASLFGYRATDWSEVKIIVIGTIIWCLFGTVSMIWMMVIHPTIPVLVGGFYVFLMVLFFILFLYAYFTHP